MGLFHSVFSTKPRTLLSSTPHPLHDPTFLILLHLITRILFGEHYRSLSSSLCNFLYSPVTLSHLGPNILLNTINLLSSLNVSDQVSHLYNTNKHKYSSVNLQIYIFVQQTGRQKILHRIITNIRFLLCALNFLLNIIVIRYCCSQKFELFHPFHRKYYKYLPGYFDQHCDLETRPRT